MTAPPLVLLDLDGTLTDSAPGIITSLRATYVALGLPMPNDAALRTFVGPPLVPSFRTHGVPGERVAEAVATYRTDYAAHGMWKNAVFAGIPQALAVLRAAGVTLLIATSKPMRFAGPITQRFALADAVDGVFGAPPDLVSSDKAAVIAAALASPAAAGWDPARMLMVGDRCHDVAGARAHGIDTLGAGWGYGPAGELAAAGAAAVVGQPDELAGAVLTRFHRAERAHHRLS